MQRFVTTGAIAAALIGPATALAQDSSAEVEALRQELATMRTEIAELKNTQTDYEKTAASAIQDAQGKPRFDPEGFTAGHDGKKFFLADPDGAFRMDLGGQLQFRYIYNSRENAPGTGIGSADDLAGFQFRRVKLKGDGYIADPKLGFFFTLANNRDGNDTSLEDAGISYEFDNGMEIQAGRFKAPFSFDELTSSSRQQAVERSLVNEQFTVGYTEGVQLSFDPGDSLGVRVMLNDGALSGESGNGDFNETPVDFGVTGRLDYTIGGSSGFAKDYTSWVKDESGINLGLAAHHQVFKSGVGQAAGPLDALTRLTADVLYNAAGLSLFGAAYYETQDAAAGNAEADPFGFQAQIGYTIDDKWEPFARYEYIDTDAPGSDAINIVTAGVNYYLKKHSAKFTADVVYALDPLTGITVSDGLGLQGDAADEDGQFAVRAQFQLLF